MPWPVKFFFDTFRRQNGGDRLKSRHPCVIDSPKTKVSESFFEIANSLNDESIYVQASDVIKVRTSDGSSKKSNAFWEKFGITPNVAEGVMDFKKEEDEVIKVKRAVHNFWLSA
jgi:hypothetical protein